MRPKRLYQQNYSNILIDGNHLVFIATPSGWDENDQKLYADMARVAGIPLGGITKESRAALIRAQHDQASGLRRNATNGAIVFDMGSSTLDFSYCGQDIMGRDKGYDCGASFIEKHILKEAEENSAAVRLFKEKYPSLVDYLLFECRKKKEEIYSSITLPNRLKLEFDDIPGIDEELEDESYKRRFEPGELNTILQKAGYISEIADSMRKYVQNEIQGLPIYAVCLTGGAAKMDFLPTLIKEIWGISENNIYKDTDPSLTISRGIAEYARITLRTDGVDTKVGNMIEKLKKNNGIYDAFVQNFGSAIYSNVTDGIADVINDFGSSSKDASLNDLQNRIQSRVQRCVQSTTPQAIEMLNEAIQEETKDIREAVESAVFAYTKLHGDKPVALPSLNIEDPNIVKGLSLNEVIKGVSETIAKDSNNWSGAIAGAAIGAAVAMILGGPLMWMVGLAGYFGSKFLGGSEEDKKKKAMQNKMKQEDRAKVVSSLGEKWESEILPSVWNSISQSLTNNNQIRRSISNAVNTLLTSYENSLKEARILID